MLNGLSVDLEAWYHAELLRRHVDPARADPQLEAATAPILALLAARGVRATFFTVGEVLGRAGGLVRAIAAAGHEIACHGYSHRPLWQLDPESLAGELVAFRAALEGLGLGPALGYRAPTFSLSARTAWALGVLAQGGYRYDSSVFPVRAGLYGVPGAPLAPYRPALTDLCRHDPGGPLLELPLAAWRALGTNWPVAGGFYLRALPFSLLRGALRRIRSAGRPFVLYLHPWEAWPATPRVRGLRPWERWVTYVGSRAVLGRLRALLDEFQFAPLCELGEEHWDSHEQE